MLPSSIPVRLLSTTLLLSSCARPENGSNQPPPAPTATAPTGPSTTTSTDAAPNTTPPLLREYPALGASLPIEPLGSFPTPVEPARRLGARLGLDQLYLKRDDLSSSTCGGSKVRKLRFLLGEARRLGRRQLLTFGGIGSNHAMATAVFGRQSGFDVTLLLAPEPRAPHLQDRLLVELGAGAKLRFFPSVSQAQQWATGVNASQDTYVIPPGGTSSLGSVGYVDAAFELKKQIDDGLMPEPDLIYIAVGTMGSAAGLQIGLAAAGLRSEVVPVRASSATAASPTMLTAHINATVRFVRGLDSSFPAVDAKRLGQALRHDQAGAGYAHPTERSNEAMAMYEEATGRALDPTYTAKALAALVADAPRLRGKVVLFWVTHGEAAAGLPRGTPEDLPPLFRPYLQPRRGEGARIDER